MNLYFLSTTPCALTVDGAYVGVVDDCPQRLTLDHPTAFMSAMPTDDGQPHHFLFNDDFLRHPPPFVDVYLGRDEATLAFHSFTRKSRPLSVLLQTRFEGTLVTVFSLGPVTLSLEGKTCRLYDLPDDFHQIHAERGTIGDRPVLLLKTNEHTAILSAEGKLVYLQATAPVCGQRMTVDVPCHTCTNAVRHETYGWQGDELVLLDSHTEERVPPDGSILHFAFFQGLLTGYDVTDYLAADLRPRLADLKTFLGDFHHVLIPTESAQAKYGGRLVGATYDGGYPNRFLLRHYAVSVVNGKIDDISSLD